MIRAHRHARGILLATVAVAIVLFTSCTSDPDETAPPTATEPTTSLGSSDETPRVDFGGRLEPNVTYPYPMDLHCGLDQLGEFNGVAWILTEAPGGNPEQGAGQSPPAHWPLGPEGVDGRLTLVGQDRIEYSLPDGELIAVYEPSPDPFVPCE
jgi:hypothetical protein